MQTLLKGKQHISTAGKTRDLSVKFLTHKTYIYLDEKPIKILYRTGQLLA